MTIPHFSGIFSAHSSATKHSNPDAYDTMIETTQAEGIPARITALKSDLKLKKQSSNPAQADEYISYVPPVQKQEGGAYKLKFKHPRGEQAPDAFIRDSLTKAERIERILLADNMVAQGNGIVHSKYISPKFIKHANGGIDKYVAAKHAFATNVDLPALPDLVSVKMLDNGSIRIQIKKPGRFSIGKLHDEKVALPIELRRQVEGEDAIGQQGVEIAAFVNRQIRHAKNLAEGQKHVLNPRQGEAQPIAHDALEHHDGEEVVVHGHENQ
jgi:hypothetical protein